MPTWTIDPDHSVAAFAIRHMMISFVHGLCNGVSGTIEYDPADPAGLSVEAAIDIAGLDTGVAQRNAHLLSQDFFDAERFPAVTFRSTGAELKAERELLVRGELTIRGVTRPVVLDVAVSGPVTSDDSDTSMGFRATATLNREDFGITWNVPVGATGFMVGKHVDLSVEIEADLVK
jgi:polyisoprenoid-binding protein YceI